MATRRIREFQRLKSNLEDFGLYEKGMDLEEMRKIKNILAESSSMVEEETSFSKVDMETALRESELDFQPQDFLSSTMITPIPNDNVIESGYESKVDIPIRNNPSPDTPLQLVVYADVHHELDWSPPVYTPLESKPSVFFNSRKRSADKMSPDDSGISAAP